MPPRSIPCGREAATSSRASGSVAARATGTRAPREEPRRDRLVILRIGRGEGRKAPLLVQVCALGQFQRQTFCSPASLDEFSQRRQRRGESRLAQLTLEPFGSLVENDPPAAFHRVAGEMQCVRKLDLQAALGRREAFDPLHRLRVEGRRIIHQPAVGERAETSVEVIEARIDETQRYDGPLERGFEQRRRLGARAPAVTAPDEAARRIRQSVARALEGNFLRPGRDGETLRSKKAWKKGSSGRRSSVMKRLSTTVRSNARPALAVNTMSGRRGCGGTKSSSACSARSAAQAFPFLTGAGEVGLPDLMLHPGIDDVVDAIMIGRAHDDALPLASPRYSAALA